MRTPLVAGNWKMHGSQAQTKVLIEGITRETTSFHGVEILLLPPFVYLSLARSFIANTPLHLGAQNVYVGDHGAFTGEVSASMLADMGCEYVLIGHSERRTIFKEDLTLTAKKFKTAVEANLKPILCVGETQKERESGATQLVIQEQILSIIEMVEIAQWNQTVIAYEPVWAIGTGLTATPQAAEEVHRFIRELIAQNNVDLAKTMRILYGGSMKPDNASALLAMPNIDGGLIGGASLDVASFTNICAAANQAQTPANAH